MLGFLPSWLAVILSLALLGLVVVIGTRVTGKLTNKVGI